MKASHASIVLVAAGLGAVLGLGTYTFAYARGWAYLTNDPRACANCHVMNEQFDGWIKSSHRAVAVCNDCHVPHDFVGKYTTKARNGFWHSYYFTTGTFPEPIRATPRAATSRRRTAADVTSRSWRRWAPRLVPAPSISCVRCHGSVGHLELLRPTWRERCEVNGDEHDAATRGWSRRAVITVAVVAASAPRPSRLCSSTSWSGRRRRRIPSSESSS